MRNTSPLLLKNWTARSCFGGGSRLERSIPALAVWFFFGVQAELSALEFGIMILQLARGPPRALLFVHPSSAICSGFPMRAIRFGLLGACEVHHVRAAFRRQALNA
jgi:hypothetical protein